MCYNTVAVILDLVPSSKAAFTFEAFLTAERIFTFGTETSEMRRQWVLALAKVHSSLPRLPAILCWELFFIVLLSDLADSLIFSGVPGPVGLLELLGLMSRLMVHPALSSYTLQ